MLHQSHPAIVRRLKQAKGHLAAVLEMFDQGRSCAELAQQLHAVESAIHTAKRTLIQDHMEHCIGDSLAGGSMDAKTALREFKTLAKYL